MRSLLAVLALCLSIALVACGGEDSTSDREGREIPGDADPEAARVIDEWSTALREGDLERAAGYFALPAVAQNGTPPLRLATREDVVEFNRALPCGAELTRVDEDAGLTVATFELTERAGEGKCGAGVGNTAKTAFEIEDGKISEWIRVVDDPVAEPPADAPVV